jgi:tripartite-type tricarboxylate transporter receptor subunit TctC
MGFVRSGALRVLAAATPKREPYMPDTPTFAELGFPGFETSTWFALFAPRGTPGQIVNQLNVYTRSVHHDAESQRRLDANFVDSLVLTAAEFGALVKADAAKWERVVRETGAKLQ